MKVRSIVRGISCLTVGLVAFLAFSESQTKTVDDLAGLRPNTDGVATNKFWDTRAHTTYTVKVDGGVSTNAIDTAVLTLAASEAGTIGQPQGLTIILR